MSQTSFRYWIRKFGRALNFDTGTHEKFHQQVVVKPFKADARREEGQLHRLYIATNVAQCLHAYLRTREEVSQPAGGGATSSTNKPESERFVLKDKLTYSYKEYVNSKIVSAREAAAASKVAAAGTAGAASNKAAAAASLMRQTNCIKSVIQKTLGTSVELHHLEIGRKMVGEYDQGTLLYICNQNYIKSGERYNVYLKYV